LPPKRRFCSIDTSIFSLSDQGQTSTTRLAQLSLFLPAVHRHRGTASTKPSDGWWLTGYTVLMCRRTAPKVAVTSIVASLPSIASWILKEQNCHRMTVFQIELPLIEKYRYNCRNLKDREGAYGALDSP
jgi:hypothetical protein